MRPVSSDGRPTAEAVAEFIKPNDRLTSFERIELYNRQYWFRLVDVMYEDYPGLAALLGQKRYNKFCEAYLSKYPSRSGLLGNLGRNIATFIEEAPEFTAPYTRMALDMARYEWAQVKAFDAATKPRLTIDDLLGKDPASTRLTLQPHITLLDMEYAVDRLLIAVKKQEARSEASNATDGIATTHRRRRSARKERVFLIVHRLTNVVYLKRLEEQAFVILAALQSGKTILEAIEAATPEIGDGAKWGAQVQEWFKLWMTFGWFCRK
jgi:hypothetical protein